MIALAIYKHKLRNELPVDDLLIEKIKTKKDW